MSTVQWTAFLNYFQLTPTILSNNVALLLYLDLLNYRKSTNLSFEEFFIGIAEISQQGKFKSHETLEKVLELLFLMLKIICDNHISKNRSTTLLNYHLWFIVIGNELKNNREFYDDLLSNNPSCPVLYGMKRIRDKTSTIQQEQPTETPLNKVNATPAVVDEVNPAVVDDVNPAVVIETIATVVDETNEEVVENANQEENKRNMNIPMDDAKETKTENASSISLVSDTIQENKSNTTLLQRAENYIFSEESTRLLIYLSNDCELLVNNKTDADKKIARQRIGELLPLIMTSVKEDQLIETKKNRTMKKIMKLKEKTLGSINITLTENNEFNELLNSMMCFQNSFGNLFTTLCKIDNKINTMVGGTNFK